MAEPTYRAPDGFLTMTAAAERLSVSMTTLKAMVTRGALTTYRDPRDQRVRLFKVGDVEALTRVVPEASEEGKVAA